jgi:predicted GNAT family acetyltransferase
MSEPAGEPDGEHGPDVRALHGNLAEHYAYHGAVPGSEFHREDDVVWFLSGRPVNALNAVMSATFARERAAERVDEVLSPFMERSLPMRWWTDERGIVADLNGALERRGLDMKWDVPGMTVDLAEGLRASSGMRGVGVRRVGDRRELRTWFVTFGAAFGFDPGRERPWLDALEALGFAEDGPLRHYLAMLDGEAVATATMFLGAGAAGIYHVGTRPDVRGLGIGGQVTLAPLLEARAAGVRWGVLKASRLGRGVYARLGFAERTRLRQYRWAPPS